MIGIVRKRSITTIDWPQPTDHNRLTTTDWPQPTDHSRLTTTYNGVVQSKDTVYHPALQLSLFIFSYVLALGFAMIGCFFVFTNIRTLVQTDIMLALDNSAAFGEEQLSTSVAHKFSFFPRAGKMNTCATKVCSESKLSWLSALGSFFLLAWFVVYFLSVTLSKT